MCAVLCFHSATHLARFGHNLLLEAILEQPIILAIQAHDLQIERRVCKLAAHLLLDVSHAVHAAHNVHIDEVRVLAVRVLVPSERGDVRPRDRRRAAGVRGDLRRQLHRSGRRSGRVRVHAFREAGRELRDRGGGVRLRPHVAGAAVCGRVNCGSRHLVGAVEEGRAGLLLRAVGRLFEFRRGRRRSKEARLRLLLWLRGWLLILVL